MKRARPHSRAYDLKSDGFQLAGDVVMEALRAQSGEVIWPWAQCGKRQPGGFLTKGRLEARGVGAQGGLLSHAGTGEMVRCRRAKSQWQTLCRSTTRWADGQVQAVMCSSEEMSFHMHASHSKSKVVMG